MLTFARRLYRLNSLDPESHKSNSLAFDPRTSFSKLPFSVQPAISTQLNGELFIISIMKTVGSSIGLGFVLLMAQGTLDGSPVANSAVLESAAQDGSGICANFPVSTDRKCGPNNGYHTCPQPPTVGEVQACSQYGYCVPPSDPEWPLAAFAGCQWEFGVCIGAKPTNLTCQLRPIPSSPIPACPGYEVTTGQRCGVDQGGFRCAQGYCCSPWGWCGLSSQVQGPEYCQVSQGCQLGYGLCYGDGVPSCTVGPQPTLPPRPSTTSAAPTSSIPTSLPTLSTTGLPTTGLPTTGLPTTGLPTTGLPTTGLPTTGLPTTGLPTSLSTTGTTTATLTASATVTQTTTSTNTIIESPFPEELLPPTCSSYYLPPTATAPSTTVPIPTTVPQDCQPPIPREDTVYSKGLLESDAGTAVKASAGAVGAAAAGAWGFGEWYTRNRIAKL